MKIYKESINEVIKCLWTLSDKTAVVKVQQIHQALNGSITSSRIETILLQLEFDRLVNSVFRQSEVTGSYYGYTVNYNLVSLIESAPSEYENKLYDFFLTTKKNQFDKEQEHIQSQIDINIITTKNLRFQRNFGIWSLVLTGISVFFIALTVIQQSNDKTGEELQRLRTVEQSQSKALESIVSSLKELNSSMKKSRIDSVYVLPQKK
ncbi:MAG: hypothetical protein QM802_11985 [Agriterribacter sp.]